MSLVAEYKQLIADVPPKVIHSEKENRYYLGKIDAMGRFDKGGARSLRDTGGVDRGLREENLSEPGGVTDRGDSGADGSERAQAERLGGSV